MSAVPSLPIVPSGFPCGMQALMELEHELNAVVAAERPERLPPFLDSRRPVLQGIHDAGILPQAMERLIRVADRREILPLPEVREISMLVRGTLAFLREAPPSAASAAATASSMAVYPERSSVPIARTYLQSVIEAVTHPFHIVRVSDRRVLLANSASGIDIHAADPTCHMLTHGTAKPCTGDDHFCPLTEVVRTKRPVATEHVHRKSDGTDAIVKIHAYPIFDRSGNVIQMIEYALDVTAERTARAALMESEEKFRRIFEEGPLAIAIVTPDNHFVNANHSMTRLLGYSGEEMAGLVVDDVTHPDDRSRNAELAREMFDGKIPGFSMIKRYARKDGSFFWGRLTISPMTDDSGKPVYAIGMMEDITTTRRLEEMEIQRAKAEERIRATRFISRGLAHDLNNALGSIIGPVSLIDSGESVDRELLETIEYGIHRMTHLVRSVQELGAEAVSGPPFNINLELIAQDLAAIFGGREGLKVRLDQAPWKVPGPRGEIARVIQNIVGNARDMMEGRAESELFIETGKVTLGLRDLEEERNLYRFGGKPGQYMRITFRDTGPGIPREFLDRIFETGFSTKKKFDGHQGLGLALCRKIVSDAGGFITAQNDPRGGARFDVYLPRVDEE